MPKGKHKAVRAPKGLRKKLTKQPLPFEQLGQEDAQQGLDVDVDAVGSGGFGTEVLQKLDKQRKEISEGQDHTANALAEMEGRKGRKPISYHFNYQPTEGDTTSSPMRVRANINNVYIVLSVAELSRAASASTEGLKAIEQGNIEESFNHYIRAERSLGQALAFTRVERVTSWIAKAKAKSGHRGTNALRAQVMKFWRDKVDPTLSAEKAADEIRRRFSWGEEKSPENRTVVKWIATEKKQGASSK